jgi:phosphopantothenate synthetase
MRKYKKDNKVELPKIMKEFKNEEQLKEEQRKVEEFLKKIAEEKK